MGGFWTGALWAVGLHALTWPAMTGGIPWGAFIVGPPVLFFYLQTRKPAALSPETDRE